MTPTLGLHSWGSGAWERHVPTSPSQEISFPWFLEGYKKPELASCGTCCQSWNDCNAATFCPQCSLTTVSGRWILPGWLCISTLTWVRLGFLNGILDGAQTLPGPFGGSLIVNSRRIRASWILNARTPTATAVMWRLRNQISLAAAWPYCSDPFSLPCFLSAFPPLRWNIYLISPCSFSNRPFIYWPGNDSSTFMEKQ